MRDYKANTFQMDSSIFRFGLTPIQFVVYSYDKRNAFTKTLKVAHYAPTLGDVRTIYQQPIYSSQNHMPDEERRRIGITPAMFRVSVGIESIEDLIADFTNALNTIQ